MKKLEKVFEGAKTGGELMASMDKLETKELVFLKSILDDMSLYFGLTMRDEFILTFLVGEIKVRGNK